MHPDSLEAALNILLQNDVNDDFLYARLAPSHPDRVKFHLDRFNRVVTQPRPAGSPKSDKQWTNQRNRIKGRCFELMMKSLLPKIFQKWDRIQTDTNELDILLELGPTCSMFPALREWGALSICECKSNKDTFSVTWVDKLAGVLDKHTAKVGIVMGTRAPNGRGNSSRALQSVRFYAIKNRTIVILDLADVQKCLNGENALKLIVRRYLEVKSGIAKYRLLAD